MSQFYYDLTELDVDDVEQKLIYEASRITATPQRPLFILLEQVNMFDDKETPRISAIEFNRSNLTALFELIRDPYHGWETYTRLASTIGSDVVSHIVSQSKDPAERESYPEVWITRKIALYNSDNDDLSKEALSETVFKEFLDSIPPFTVYQKHNNGVFNAKFNNKYDYNSTEGKEYVRKYWKKIYDEPALRKNFCYEKQLIDDCLSPDEKAEIGREPCAIYALRQCDVDPKVIRDIYANYVCYGNIVKTKDLKLVLNRYQYRLKIYKISICSNKVTITNDVYPNKSKNKDWKMIELDFYKGHLMKHETIEVLRKNHRGIEKEISVPFLRLLHLGFEMGILRPMNSYEFADVFEERSFSLNYKQSTKELLESIDDEHIFDGDCVPFVGFNKGINKNIIYADFECAVNEQYHRPYCVSFTTTNKTEAVRHYWGEDCGKKFLDELQKTFCKEKMHWKNPVCVVYFHNLRYDFTFLIKYLRNIDITKKGDKLYCAKGKYGKGLEKICIEFRDTLPLLQMSLRNAGRAFLSKEVQATIKKEAFPYDLYTYDFFEVHPSGWCTLEEFRNGFGKDELLQDFDNNLVNLPENIYDKEKEHIFYKEYSFFYCDQDVRVLREVMDVYDGLMRAEGQIEGVVGTPPFGSNYSPFKYLTVSSLAYDFCLKNCVLEWKQEKDIFDQPKKTEKGYPIMKWLPKHDFYRSRGLLRYIGHQTIRGGRVMTRDNEKWHYQADPNNPDSMLTDYDGVSLYPSAISRLWMTEGKPLFIKGSFDQSDFLAKFTSPDAPEGEFKEYNDGWIHIYSLNCVIDRHFPLLCVKDEKTKLNEYKNFHGHVDTWVNAIDLFNLIEFQEATFYWDAAVVWKGSRHYECREMIKNLFSFRANNKSHPIQLTTKLMMNSIYGKSALKPTNHIETIIDSTVWRKNGEEENIKWERVDNWRETFNANAYKIKDFSYLDKNHIAVKFHELDMSANYVQFGSNVLAMARRIIGRVMALAEDMEQKHPECCPGLFYTDTDSMHIRKDLLQYTENAYLEKYGEPIKGFDLCQFHIDFDPIITNNEKEPVEGALESWFIMKKMYADKLLGKNGSIGYHQRMKGVPSDLVHWEDYEKIYNDQFVEFDLLENGHVSFFYEKGHVGSRKKMTRQIATKEAKEQLNKDLDVVNNFVEALERLPTPTIGPLDSPHEELWVNPAQGEWMEGDTQELLIFDEETQFPGLKRTEPLDEIDIETDNEERPLKIAKIDF